MAFAIPLVYVSDSNSSSTAIREANQFASQNPSIGYVGEPVLFQDDVEDLEAEPANFVAVVEVR